MERIIEINLNDSHTGVYSESDALFLLVNRHGNIGTVRIISKNTHLMLGTCLFDDESFSFMFIDSIKMEKRDFDGHDFKNDYRDFTEFVEECLMDHCYDLLNEVIWNDENKNEWYKDILDECVIRENRKELTDVYFLDLFKINKEK